MAHTVKNLSAMQGDSLIPRLEKIPGEGPATPSNILARRIS